MSHIAVPSTSAVSELFGLHNWAIGLGLGWACTLAVARSRPDRYVVEGRIFGRDML